jgi:phosphatidylethanolamine-binding protein (PEBP) family uncharacterized protein
MVARLGVLLLATGCCTGSHSEQDGVPPTLALGSSAFADGGAIPARYTCDGANVSPPLAWSACRARPPAWR